MLKHNLLNCEHESGSRLPQSRVFDDGYSTSTMTFPESTRHG